VRRISRDPHDVQRDLNAACNLQQAAEEYRRLKTRAEDETEVGAAGPVV